MNPIRLERHSGLTLLEVAVAVVLMGVLAFGARQVLAAKYGEKERVRTEARGLVDDLLELRAHASQGMKNPCLDFPDSLTVRTYSDSTSTPQGFQAAADLLLRQRRLPAGVRVSVSGGQGATHFVCFESRGIVGSAGAPLLVTLRAANPLYAKKVRLLPSTGMARIL
jgi:prepilin-type N-terminal cleavage/methylation domain-containing protein